MLARKVLLIFSLMLLVLLSVKGMALAQAECQGCHAKQVADWTASKHTTVNCAVCHEGSAAHAITPATKPKVHFTSEVCQSCHQDQYNSFFTDKPIKTRFGGGVDPVTMWPKTRDLPYWNALIDGHGFVIETYEERNMMWNQLDAQETLRPMAESCLVCHGTKVAYYQGMTGLPGFGPGPVRTIENTQQIWSGNFAHWQSPALPFVTIPAGTTVQSTVNTTNPPPNQHRVESVVTFPDGRIYTTYSPYPGATATGDDVDPVKRTEARNHIWAAFQALALDGLDAVYSEKHKMFVGANANSANAAATCNMCHDPMATKLRLIQKASLYGIANYGINPYSNTPIAGIPPEVGPAPVYDFNLASRVDQIGAVCGQCHCEYVGGYSAVDGINRHYFPFAKPTGTAPNPPAAGQVPLSGLGDRYMELFGNNQDFIHGVGVRPWQRTDPAQRGYYPSGSLGPINETLVKTQHPEMEAHWNSPMYLFGAACTDCHAQQIAKPGGGTFTDHSFASPMKFLVRGGSNGCQKCHDPAAPLVGAPAFTTDDLINQISIFQDDIFLQQWDLQRSLVSAQKAISAQAAGPARDANVALFRKAHLIWEYYSNGENSMGFHNWDDVITDMTTAMAAVSAILSANATLGPVYGLLSEGAGAAAPPDVPANTVDLLWTTTEPAAVVTGPMNPDSTFPFAYNGLAFELQRRVVNANGTLGPWITISPAGGISAEPYIVATEPDAPPAVNYADTNNVVMGMTYEYRVRNIKGNAFSIWSWPIRVVTVETVLMPTLMVAATAGSEVKIHWFAELGGTPQFRIQRASDANFTSGLADFVATPGDLFLNGWSDTTAPANSTVYYRVRGEDPLDVTLTSPWTETLIVQTEGPPKAPDMLIVTGLGAQGNQLTWWDVSASETGFRIERANDPGFATGLVSFVTGANTVTYTDTTAVTGQTYYYRVFAFNALGDSVPVTPFVADTLNIVSGTYDGAAQTLTVAATSSDQPNVQLTAEGFGTLGWKSWLNFYRTTFTGVAARPASVTVTSSGGGSATYNFPAADAVSISSVTYNATNQTLTVVATSSLQPNVSLTAQGYGNLGWKSWLNFYRTTFTGVAAKPASVTVSSTGGGSATLAVP